VCTIKVQTWSESRHKFEIVGQLVRLGSACHWSFKNIKPNYLTVNKEAAHACPSGASRVSRAIPLLLTSIPHTHTIFLKNKAKEKKELY
jgi:hypothetical protein